LYFKREEVYLRLGLILENTLRDDSSPLEARKKKEHMEELEGVLTRMGHGSTKRKGFGLVLSFFRLSSNPMKEGGKTLTILLSNTKGGG